MGEHLAKSIRKAPPLIPRLNKEKEIEFSIKPTDAEEFFHRFQKEHNTNIPKKPITSLIGSIIEQEEKYEEKKDASSMQPQQQQEEKSNKNKRNNNKIKNIFNTIEDIRRIIFLLITEPRSSLLSCIQYIVLICLIILSNVIMIMQTNRKRQYIPDTCKFCNTSDEIDSFNLENELTSSLTLMNETIASSSSSYDYNEVNDVIDTAIDEVSIPCVCPPRPNDTLGMFYTY